MALEISATKRLNTRSKSCVQKGKDKTTLFSVGSSISSAASINGSRRCALYLLPSVGALFYWYLKL